MMVSPGTSSLTTDIFPGCIKFCLSHTKGADNAISSRFGFSGICGKRGTIKSFQVDSNSASDAGKDH